MRDSSDPNSLSPAAADPDPVPEAWDPYAFVDLTAAVQVSRGNLRLVFEHPAHRGALIKVVDPDLIGPDGHLNERWRRRPWLKRRVGALLELQRELPEFFVVRRQGPTEPWPIARMLGYVETNLGLGLVVERISGPDGGLAPTLHTLLTTGRFTNAHRLPLQHLFDELARLHVRIGNLHLRNIVFTGSLGAGGRFVAIDGLGDKALIPITDWSKRLNALRVRRHARRTFERVDRLQSRVSRAHPSSE